MKPSSLNPPQCLCPLSPWTQNHSGAANPQQYTLGYDSANQLVAATLKNVTSGATLQEEDFGFDLIGNRTLAQKDQAPEIGQYNELNQLVSKSAGGSMQVRGGLNEAGSMTIEKLSGTGGTVQSSKVATVESGSNKFTAQIPVEVGANALRLKAKDASGNETIKEVSINVPSGPSFTYKHDLNGNLIEVKENGVITRIYEWDAADRMVAAHDPVTDKHTLFSYNGSSKWAKITHKVGVNVIGEKRFVWEGISLAEERDASDVVQKRFFGSGEWRVGDLKLFYLRDHLGNVREMTDFAGAVRARYSYELWGKRAKISGDLESDFGFTGHYFDAPTGLTVAPFRFYDAELGRWLSRDPIAEEGGLNLYGYAFNSPVNYVDPEGASPTLVTGAIGAGIGALVGGGITAWNGGSWSEIGMSAGRGAIAGGVAGLTMGIGGGAVAGVFGGGVLGGAASGAVAGAAGNVAAQGFDFATGSRCEFGWGELGMSAGAGALFGGAFARPWTAPNQQITSWASNGVTPNLDPGRWVMTGGPSLGNYARTVGPALRGYPYGNSATSTVPGSTLSYPPGATGNMAGILGQRVVNP